MSDLDEGKLPVWSAVVGWFPRAIREVARTSAYGNANRPHQALDEKLFSLPGGYTKFTDSLVRHLLDEQIEGEINHSDGELYHASQVAWNALVRLEILMREKEKEPLKLPEAPEDTNTDLQYNFDNYEQFLWYKLEQYRTNKQA